MSRHNAKKDNNHREIAEALRVAGNTVVDTSKFGDGFPDLVVIKPDSTVVLVEIKNLDTGAGFTKAEVEFIVRLASPAYRVVLTAENAVDTIAALRW